MIQIQQSQEHGYTIYKFEANQTEYEVLTKNGQNFDVYSSRIGRAGRTVPKFYGSIDELAKRSMAFSNLVMLINDNSQKH
jgi:hypothetical protein